MNDPNATGASAGSAYPAFWWSTYGANGLNMNSGECLLFFLGGIVPMANQVPGQGSTGPTGFAKNPVYPFSPPSASSNREGPFFEFTDISRIKDFAVNGSGNGINEWYDPLPNQSSPYLYFSSYEGRGYNLAELPNDGHGNRSRDAVHSRLLSRFAQHCRTAPLSPTSSTVGTSAAINGATNSAAQRPQSFQIISPGYDTNFGFGGVFNTNLANSGLTAPDGSADIAAYDNLTNFNGGRLKP